MKPLPRISTFSHPAPFSEPIIECLAELIPSEVPVGFVIHDPFGGEGVRLGQLCDRLTYAFSGCDLERWRGGDSRVVLADSTDSSSYPSIPFAVVTSPTYNNGVNDHFLPRDASTRLTYRVRAGHPLHENNTGRHSGRGSKRGEREYWRITRECVKHWPDICLINVKDSIRGDALYPFVQMWVDMLADEFGYDVWRIPILCPGWTFGRNGQARAESEEILVARREGGS